jgi:hypothetical protein
LGSFDFAATGKGNLTIGNFFFNEAGSGSGGGGGGGGGGGPNDPPPPPNSNLSISPGYRSVTVLVPFPASFPVPPLPTFSIPDLPVTVSNSGPNPADFHVSQTGPATVITQVGGNVTQNLAPGASTVAFSVHFNPTALGNYSTSFYANNDSDANDSGSTYGFDNEFNVNLYVNTEPHPVAYPLGRGLSQSSTSLSSTLIQDNTTGRYLSVVTLTNQIFNNSNSANAVITSESVSNPAFTFNATPDLQLLGNYEYNKAFQTAPNLLNGHYQGTYICNLGVGYAFNSSDPTLAPNTYQITVQLTADVTNHTGPGFIPVSTGQSYKNISTKSALTSTLVSLVDGVAANSGNVTIDFPATSAGSTFTINGANPIGNVVSLSGTAGTLFTLQLFISDADLGPHAPGQEFDLLWHNPVDPDPSHWVPAYLGNSDPNANALFPNTPYSASLFQLGNYGFSYVTGGINVWAVLDHNSDFAIATSPIPEPSSALLPAPLLLLSTRRRR